MRPFVSFKCLNKEGFHIEEKEFLLGRGYSPQLKCIASTYLLL
jgi:hypothetical protein